MKDVPDSAFRYILSAQYSLGNTELTVNRLGGKQARAQGRSFLALHCVEGGCSDRETQVCKGLHVNYTLVGEYYFQDPLCYLAALPKPNGVIPAKGKISQSQ